MKSFSKKMDNLYKLLRGFESVVVGFSGGVDSSFLAAAARNVLGDRAIAITASSAALPEEERIEAADTARQIGIEHLVLPINELDVEEFTHNSPNRCYYCKKYKFSLLTEWANREGYAWVLEGSNADDVRDYRPGMKAIEELNMVRSPLLEVGLTKQEIREVSKQWGLPSWNKQSSACLSSRIAYGLTITAERLAQVERAEAFIKEFCSGQLRVRHHDNIARIETELDCLPVLVKPANAAAINEYLKSLGFTYVTIDLAGFKSGSLNAEINKLK